MLVNIAVFVSIKGKGNSGCGRTEIKLLPTATAGPLPPCTSTLLKQFVI
jgi:hypothetical protein